MFMCSHAAGGLLGACKPVSSGHSCWQIRQQKLGRRSELPCEEHAFNQRLVAALELGAQHRH